MTAQTGELLAVRIADLKVHPLNPRTDVGDLAELEASIRANGVIEPIVVVRENGYFAVVAGTRRVAAAKRAQLVEIPAVVREMSEKEIATAALVENLQRKDLNPLEEAEGYQHYLDLTGETQVQLAKAVGRDPSTVSNALRLLKAPVFVKDALRGKTLTAAHARVLLQVKDPAQYDEIQKELGKRPEKVSVDDLQEIVQGANDDYATRGPAAIAAAKQFLEEARAKHPKAAITWKAGSPGYQGILDLVEALGDPSAKFTGAIRSSDKKVDSWSSEAAHPTPAAHAKHCDCSAYLIEAQRDYGHAHAPAVEDRLKFTLRRVCIVSANYKKAKPVRPKRSSSAGSSSKPKELTPAQQAKRDADVRKHADAEVTRQFAEVAKAAEPRLAPIFARLRKGQIPADVARALAYVGLTGYIEGQLFGEVATLVAWERIEKMPAKKVSELAANVLADAVQNHLRRAGTGVGEDLDQVAAATYFGVKVKEPKAAKKKARR